PRGDRRRGLVSAGLVPPTGGVNFVVEQPNRGKRSVGLDLGRPAGRDLLYRLVETADVFLTNFLPAARRRLAIEVDDIRRVNPKIVYVRGHGQGARGPERERGGYDAASFWCRGGIANALTPLGAAQPVMQRAPLGHSAGGMTVAGRLAAAPPTAPSACASWTRSSPRARSPSGGARWPMPRACGPRCRPRASWPTTRRRSPTATCARWSAATARASRWWRARSTSTRPPRRSARHPTWGSTPRRCCSRSGSRGRRSRRPRRRAPSREKRHPRDGARAPRRRNRACRRPRRHRRPRRRAGGASHGE